MNRRKLLILLLALMALVAVPGIARAETESTGSDINASGDAGASNQGSGTGLGGPYAVTSADIAASVLEPGTCTANTEVAVMTASGHALSTRVKVCGVWYGTINGQTERWGPVIRFSCWRDGVAFGSGTGGCRWKGSLSQYIGAGETPNRVFSDYFQVPSSDNPGDFWQDSGRIYGASNNYSMYQGISFCSDDWLYTGLGIAAGNGAVHWKGITGIDYGTHNMGNKCNTFNTTTAH